MDDNFTLFQILVLKYAFVAYDWLGGSPLREGGDKLNFTFLNHPNFWTQQLKMCLKKFGDLYNLQSISSYYCYSLWNNTYIYH